MTEALFVRLLASEDKGADLASSLAALRQGQDDARVFEVDPESFRQIPGAPFAYWVSERVRRLFKELPPFEGEGRTVRQGLATAHDFRFVRAWWEVAPERILDAQRGPDWRKELPAFQAWCRKRTHEGKRWVPFAKGGEYSPYYADIHLVVNWEWEGREIKEWICERYPYLNGNWEWVAKNTGFYFRPGLTWPRRTNSNFGIRAMPPGCVFADKGPAAFLETQDLGSALLVLFSQPYQMMLEIFMAAGDETQSGTPSRSYEVGIVQKLPWPRLATSRPDLEADVGPLLGAAMAPDRVDETTHLFLLAAKATHLSLGSMASGAWREVEGLQHEAFDAAAHADSIVATLLGLEPEAARAVLASGINGLLALPSQFDDEVLVDHYERSVHELIRDHLDEEGGDRQVAVKSFSVSRHLEVLARRLKVNPRAVVQRAKALGLIPTGLVAEHAGSLASYLLGCVFGRWDVRLATGECPPPGLPDPFDPLPVCSPGMLVGEDGLPLRTIPEGYPLSIDWDGILVDDPGHPDDLLARIRQVLEVIYRDRAGAIEVELNELLGLKDLRDYFRRPTKGGFWLDHVARYSKSRRKAPIYWLLQSKKRNYALWLYYHRLDRDLLYKALVNYVEPKLRLGESRLKELEEARILAGPTGREAKQLAREAEAQEELVQELAEFAQALSRAAELHLTPDLDDGVLLNIAPLWELVPWKEAATTWQELLKGEYPWSSVGQQLRERGVVRS